MITLKENSIDQSWKEVILYAFPENLRAMIEGLPSAILDRLEEIRIREGRPLVVHGGCRDYFIDRNGNIVPRADKGYFITRRDTRHILDRISDYSIYALEDELKNGYITLKGGHRVGVTGRAVVENGCISTLKYINSFNFRISREIPGVANKVMPYIIKGNEVCHTLIVSPPQMGKTTLLRDIARQLSDGFPGFKGIKTGIVDERSELAGCLDGIPQKNVGMQTDVLDGCPKAEGIIMMIRSMSPRVIITDEIGKQEDVDAIEDALSAGIKVITTAHGRGYYDARTRPILSELLSKNIIERIIVLGNSKGVGTLEEVYSGLGNIIR